MFAVYPRLQYNYDQPQDTNLVEAEQPVYPQNQEYTHSQHYAVHEPEQPADIPIIVGKIIPDRVSASRNICLHIHATSLYFSPLLAID